ncbi:MAG: glycosyltransferase, partial [Armatimonadetes bacterium]|nr:glycosyltransferase [Armatimonadota bacterium]
LAAQLAGVPLVLHTVHGLALHSCRSRFLRWLYRSLETIAALWADHLIAVSPFLGKAVIEEKITQGAKVTVICHGLDLSQYENLPGRRKKREDLGQAQDAIILGAVGRLENQKGHQYLLCALPQVVSRFPKVQLIVAGDGAKRRHLEKLASRLGIRRNVHFLGFREDIPEILSALDLLVVPSLTEGFGMSLLEGMASRLPTVASKVGGIPDVAEDQSATLLVPPGDSEALASAIREILEDDVQRKAMGEAGYQRVVKYFQLKDMLEATSSLYERLSREKTGSPGAVVASPERSLKPTPRAWKTLHLTTIDSTAYCFLRSWFRTLKDQGHEVSLCCTAGNFGKFLEKEGVRLIHVPIARRIHLLQDLLSLFRLLTLMRSERFDIVHTHTSKAGFLGRLAARLSGVPLVLHTIHDLARNSTRNPLLKGFYGLLERIAARWADHIVTVSYANKDEICRIRLFPETKLTVVREGIDMDQYRATVSREEKRRQLGLSPDVPLVGMVGRLEPPKGHTYLLKAVPQVLREAQDAHFLIVGQGYLRSSLEKEARKLRIDHRVHFLGYREDMWEILCALDLFVLPSLWEGLGIVLLEAMAFRLPIVSTRVGGIVDVVLHGETGLMVEARDPESLAQAIIELLKDRERARLMGEKGYQRVVAEFKDRTANEQMLALYEKLARERGL